MADVLGPGSRFGNLEIERELGRGGFASVYLARDLRLGRRVALKVLFASGIGVAPAPAVASFLEEARIIARLQSPYVVTLFRLHESAVGQAGPLVLEMEYLSGGTLGNALADGTLGPERILPTLRGILAGLGAAHDRGVLHRDIKPANILLTPEGDAKLTDFGLARVMGDEVDLDDGAFGTPLYMAPEVLVGGPASPQSDLWSVGVVAYEILAGRLPFPAGDAATFFSAIQNEDPWPLPATVSHPLRALVARCLEKEASLRPADCREALDLLDAKSDAADVRVRAPAETFIHGRRAELEAVWRVLASAPDEPRTLVLAGEAGVGKSALLAAAARRARDSGILWIDAPLVADRGPLATLVDAVRDAMLAASEQSTAAFGPGGARAKELLRGASLPALESPQQARSTLEHLLLVAARGREVALCVDDAQHASAEDVALLEDLARWLADHASSLIVATRPGAAATTGFAGARRLDLVGVDGEALFAILEERLSAALPARVVSRILETTDGNPLHALELARHLLESGALVRRGNRIEATRAWGAAEVPARLRDVVHARLAALDEDDRALLEAAAVDGREFDGKALAAVLGLPVLQALRHLQRLCHDRTLIGPAARGYRFADVPTQELLYEELAPELRVELHRALALHLEARADEVEPARLARHWERSGNRARAAPYLARVACAARDRQEMERFVEYAERAGLLEDPPLLDLRDNLELALDFAWSLTARGRPDDAEALYARLLALATGDAAAALRARIEVGRGTGLLAAGRQPAEGVQHWLDLADLLGATTDGAQARSVAGRLAKLGGDLARARALLEEADAVFRELGDDLHHSVTLDYLGSVALRETRPERARALYTEAAAVADRQGRAVSAAVSGVNAALAGMLAGEIEGAERDLRRSIRTLDLAGSTGLGARTRIYLIEAVFAQGRTSAALEEVERALPELTGLGHPAALANAHRLRAELLAVLGRLDEADLAIPKALEQAESSGDTAQVRTALAVSAAIAAAQGRLEDAEKAIDAVRGASPEGSARTEGLMLLLCEATRFGLPASLLETVGDLASTDQECALRDATLLSAAGRSCAEPLELLDAQKIGLRRATIRLLRDWLAAEEAVRAGDRAEARRWASAAVEAADALEHVRAGRLLRDWSKSLAGSR